MPKIFDASNARGAAVFDVDTKERLPAVMSVDPEAGEVVMAHQPYRVTADGKEVDCFTRRYRTIHTIYGGQRTPQLA